MRSFGSLALAALLLTACSGGPATTSGQAAQASTPSAKGAALTTQVQYGGTYTEELKYTASSPLDPSNVQTIDKKITVAFRESVSLVTPKSALLGRPISTSPVSSSFNRPVYFYDSGTESYSQTPDPSKNSCTSTLTGQNGVSPWLTSSAQPPVEINVAATTVDGTLTKDYRLQVVAVLPTDGANRNITSSSPGTGECSEQVALSSPQYSPALWNNPQYTGVLWAGPNANPFLVLPLETQGYTKKYSVHQTYPYSFSGATGTDQVDADTTLTINDAGHLYAALGDSYSAGAFPPLIEDGGCQRSQEAYPEVYDQKALVFLACSGASTLQTTADQIAGIPPNAQVVSLTSGGDDFTVEGQSAGGLFALLIDCIEYQYQYYKLIPCRAVTGLTNIDSQLTTIQGNLEALIAAIHKQAEHARIYVLGYPNPLPASFTSGSCPGLENLLIPSPVGTLAVPGVSAADVGFMSNVVDSLNNTVRLAVDSSGTATFVQPFTGHDVCSADSWFFPLFAAGTGIQGQALHPNALGHLAMAQALRAAAGAPPP